MYFIYFLCSLSLITILSSYNVTIYLVSYVIGYSVKLSFPFIFYNMYVQNFKKLLQSLIYNPKNGLYSENQGEQ